MLNIITEHIHGQFILTGTGISASPHSGPPCVPICGELTHNWPHIYTHQNPHWYSIKKTIQLNHFFFKTTRNCFVPMCWFWNSCEQTHNCSKAQIPTIKAGGSIGFYHFSSTIQSNPLYNHCADLIPTRTQQTHVELPYTKPNNFARLVTVPQVAFTSSKITMRPQFVLR